MGVLYWKPIHSYQHTHAVLQRRDAQVSRLEAQQRQLKARLATVGTGPELLREARRLGFVKPGEQLFIVRGIAAWRAGLTARTTNLGRMDDLAVLERQLGRPPRAFRRVAVRCPFGAPAVVEQEPFDADGEPFPTQFWLTCRHLVGADRADRGGGRGRALDDAPPPMTPSWPSEPRARPRRAARGCGPSCPAASAARRARAA